MKEISKQADKVTEKLFIRHQKMIRVEIGRVWLLLIQGK